MSNQSAGMNIPEGTFIAPSILNSVRGSSGMNMRYNNVTPIAKPRQVMSKSNQSSKLSKKLDIGQLKNKKNINVDLFATEKPDDFFSIKLLAQHVAHVLRSKELLRDYN